MRASRRYVALGALLCSSCSPAAVDYSALTSAAEARQRAAGAATAPGAASVRELLGQPLSADKAARLAILNNRGLRAAVEELGIAEAELVRVRRLPNPSVEGALRYEGDERPALELGATIDLTELLLLSSRASAASAGVEAAKLAAVAAIVDVSFDARRAFYVFEAAAELVELRRTVLAALEASAELAARLRTAGNISELELASARSSFEDARFDLQNAELDATAARERLNAILGLWGPSAAFRSPARLPQPPSQELDLGRLESVAVERSLDLAIAKQRYAAAARRANAARARGFLPELKAGVVAEREEEWSVGPAVEVEVPLFYQGQGEVGVARAQMRQQESLFADAAVRLRSAARVAGSRLTAAVQAVGYYKTVLMPLKQRVVDESQLQYNAMSIGAFQLLQAKRDQVQTAAAYVEQLRDYWLARTDVEQLLAGRMVQPTSSTPRPPASAAVTDAH